MMKFFVLILALCVAASPALTQKSPNSATTSATSRSASGKHETLPQVEALKYSQLKEMMRRDSGHVILVNTWASWCKPCRKEMPALLRLKKKFEKKNFTLIVLSADEP